MYLFRVATIAFIASFAFTTCPLASADPQAPHGVPGLPIVPKNAGKILTRPRFVVFTFSDDKLREDKEKAVALMGTTHYWAGLAEYGVGEPTIAHPVRISDAAGNPRKIPDEAVHKLIDAAVKAGEAPEADGNTMYIVFFPSDAICNPNGPGNFHASYKAPNGRLAYFVVVPQCLKNWYQNNTGLSNATVLQGLTATLSHELSEGVVDPVLNTGYSLPDETHLTSAKSPPGELQYVAWAATAGIGGGEIADMCGQLPDGWFVSTTTGLGFQRYWSNQAAAAGGNPCQPAAEGPYFNTVPALTDIVDLGARNANPPGGFALGKSLGVGLGQGESKTVSLASYGDIVTVNVYDATRALGGNGSLAITSQAGKSNRGTMTVRVTRQDTKLGYEVGFIVSCTREAKECQSSGGWPAYGPGIAVWPFVVADH